MVHDDIQAVASHHLEKLVVGINFISLYSSPLKCCRRSNFVDGSIGEYVLLSTLLVNFFFPVQVMSYCAPRLSSTQHLMPGAYSFHNVVHLG